MELTDIDLKNLLVFLSRVDLKGSEAPTLSDLCKKIQGLLDAKNNPVM